MPKACFTRKEISIFAVKSSWSLLPLEHKYKFEQYPKFSLVRLCLCSTMSPKMFSQLSFVALLVLSPIITAVPAPKPNHTSAPASKVPAVPPPPVVSSQVTGHTSHGPFSGKPTTTGALSLSVLAPSIPALPPNPTATTYPSDGKLHDPEPAPYTPAGGLGTNGTEPVYNAKSDFDYESLVKTTRLLFNFENTSDMF